MEDYDGAIVTTGENSILTKMSPVSSVFHTVEKVRLLFLLKERFIVTSHGDISCNKGNNAYTHIMSLRILFLFWLK